MKLVGQATRFTDRATGPAERMAGFAAHLRGNGMKIGVEQTGAALEALAVVAPVDPYEVRLALKAVCTGSHSEFGQFDDLFAAHWLNRGREKASQTKPAGQERQRLSAVQDQDGMAGGGRADQTDADGDGAVEQDGVGRLTGSRIRNLMRVGLREFVASADMAEASALAERLVRAIRDRRSRRHKVAKRGTRLDLRRVVRASLATGGEPIRLYHRKRHDRPVRLVAILDVSGSMAIYAREFLAFLKGLMGADQTTDAYLFHTRLVRITEALRDPDALRAVNRLSLLAQGFGGGTRIGANLASFNRSYARRLVGGRSVVIILSDGFDTDPAAMRSEELARLKQRNCRVIWLSLLKGWQGYVPVAAGMAAALPHLDLFAAANTLERLAALEPELKRL